MENVLILNAHQKYEGPAEGKLTKIFVNVAEEFLKDSGFNVKHSIVQSDYNIEEEVEKFAWADTIIVQYPVFWMGLPWLAKKYIDEIFSAGMNKVTYSNDGRSSKDASKTYGSGGLMKDKSYMLSMTYNCPTSEFSNNDGFFEGLTLDEANIATHKTFQFCGAKKLDTYSVHDIFKGNLDINVEKEKYRNILKNNFIK